MSITLKALIISLLLAVPTSMAGNCNCERGDVDQNGCVNISDVIMWFEYVYGHRSCLPTCGGVCTPEEYANCMELDVNQDDDICPADPLNLCWYIYGFIALDLGCED